MMIPQINWAGHKEDYDKLKKNYQKLKRNVKAGGEDFRESEKEVLYNNSSLRRTDLYNLDDVYSDINLKSELLTNIARNMPQHITMFDWQILNIGKIIPIGNNAQMIMQLSKEVQISNPFQKSWDSPRFGDDIRPDPQSFGLKPKYSEPSKRGSSLAFMLSVQMNITTDKFHNSYLEVIYFLNFKNPSYVANAKTEFAQLRQIFNDQIQLNLALENQTDSNYYSPDVQQFESEMNARSPNEYPTFPLRQMIFSVDGADINNDDHCYFCNIAVFSSELKLVDDYFNLMPSDLRSVLEQIQSNLHNGDSKVWHNKKPNVCISCASEHIILAMKESGWLSAKIKLIEPRFSYATFQPTIIDLYFNALKENELEDLIQDLNKEIPFLRFYRSPFGISGFANLVIPLKLQSYFLKFNPMIILSGDSKVFLLRDGKEEWIITDQGKLALLMNNQEETMVLFSDITLKQILSYQQLFALIRSKKLQAIKFKGSITTNLEVNVINTLCYPHNAKTLIRLPLENDALMSIQFQKTTQDLFFIPTMMITNGSTQELRAEVFKEYQKLLHAMGLKELNGLENQIRTFNQVNLLRLKERLIQERAGLETKKLVLIQDIMQYYKSYMTQGRLTSIDDHKLFQTLQNQSFADLIGIALMVENLGRAIGENIKITEKYRSLFVF